MNNLFSGVSIPADTENGSLSIRKVYFGRVAGASEFVTASAYVDNADVGTRAVMFQHGGTETPRGAAADALVTAGQFIPKPGDPDMTTILTNTLGRVIVVTGDTVTLAVGDLLRFFGPTGAHGVACVTAIVGTGVNTAGVATTTIDFTPLIGTSGVALRTDTLCVRCEPAPEDPVYYQNRRIPQPAFALGWKFVLDQPSASEIRVVDVFGLPLPGYTQIDPPPVGSPRNALPEWGGHVPVFRRGGRVLLRNGTNSEQATVLDIRWSNTLGHRLVLSHNLQHSYGDGGTIHSLSRISAGDDLVAPEAFWVARSINRTPIVTPQFHGSVTIGMTNLDGVATCELPWDNSGMPGGQGAAPPPPSGDTVYPLLSPDGTIPAQASYYHTHTLAVTLEATGAALPVESVSLSMEDGSVCWSLTASGRPALYDIFAESTTPQLVRVEIDSIDWLFLVESASRTRSGPADRSVTITGRSAAMVSGEPYALPSQWGNDGRVTARAVCENAQSGTAIEWHVLDWHIPDKVLTFAGSALALVQRVSEAIGAAVICDRASNTIFVVPRYPRMPADWAATTPNVVIAEEAIRSDSFVRADKPNYTSVWVSGQQQGVLGQVYLAGTDGSAQAPLVTDLLVTDSVAVLQRGRSVLGGSGPQARITMTLPVMTGAGRPGVLSPGQLVQVGTWRGVVRSVAVNATLPTVEQTISVERHFPYP